jgi:hypothetical protein
VRLVIRAPAGWARPRLAWEVSLPRDLRRLRQERMWIDAATGAPLGRVNRILDAEQHRARVYPANPVATPALAEVVLGDLPVGAETLTGPDIAAVSCVDRRTCIELPDPEGGTLSAHACELEPVAVTNAAGNFLDIGPPASDDDPSDAFAEVHVYAHTTRAYAAFRELVGDPDFQLDSRPLTAIANFRLPAAECVDGAPPADAELAPIDNAFFAPGGELPLFDQDVIAFGQGVGLDFAYDGDVVYHELGHAFVFRLTDLPFARVDELGLDPSPAGMHEGYPDYVSSVITGDPLVGEYIGAALNPGLGAIRDLGNDLACPGHLTGESHIDSEAWSAALWQIREATAPADRPALDRAVVSALAGLGGDGSFATASALTSAEIDVALGAAASEEARAILRARGLEDCRRVIDLAVGDRRDLLIMNGYGGVPGPRIPAPLQFRVELVRPARAIRIRGDIQSSSPEVSVLLKPGAEPIRWTWSEAGGEHDAPLAAGIDALEGTGELTGDFPAGVYHLQLVSGANGATMTDIGFAPIDAVEEADAGTAAPIDAGPSGGGGEGGGDGGCSAGGGGASIAGIAIALAALAGARRLTRRAPAPGRSPRPAASPTGPATRRRVRRAAADHRRRRRRRRPDHRASGPRRSRRMSCRVQSGRWTSSRRRCRARRPRWPRRSRPGAPCR